MPSNSYPDTIFYKGQLFTHKISLKPEFKLERKAMRLLSEDDPDQCYISAQEQDQCLVDAGDDNLFYDSETYLVDGEFNFVLTCEEYPQLICDKTLHHSFMANGKKLLGTGTLEFKDGKLIGITNNSGHYRPTDEEMLATIKALYTASGGTLLNYTSFCTPEVKTYSVKKLVPASSFASVSILNEKNADDSTSLSAPSDVDEDENLVTSATNSKTTSDGEDISSTTSSISEPVDCFWSQSIVFDTISPTPFDFPAKQTTVSNRSSTAVDAYEETLVVTSTTSKTTSHYNDLPVLDEKTRTSLTSSEDSDQQFLQSGADKDDPALERSDLTSKRRFGRKLTEQLTTKYMDIINKHSFFTQKFTPNMDNAEEPVFTLQ